MVLEEHCVDILNSFSNPKTLSSVYQGLNFLYFLHAVSGDLVKREVLVKRKGIEKPKDLKLRSYSLTLSIFLAEIFL